MNSVSISTAILTLVFCVSGVAVRSWGADPGKPRPKSAAELEDFLAGTVWNIRDGSPDAPVQYTITFNKDGTFRHSDGRNGKVTFTGARTFDLWNYDPAKLAEDLKTFRAKGTTTIYFGTLRTEADAQSQKPSPILGSLIDPVALRGVEDVHLVGDYAYLPCREGERLTSTLR